MTKLALITTVAIASILISACSSSGTTQVGQNSDQQTSDETSEVDTTYAVGDQVQSGNFVFSVNEVRKNSGAGYIKPKVEHVYLITNVTIENKGQEEANISTLLQMYLKDSEGNKYTPTITGNTTGQVDGELLAGEKVKGEVAFEIPIAATDLKMYYEASWLTGKTIKVSLDSTE